MSNRNILRGPLSNESEVTNQLRPQSSDNTSPINKHLIDVMMHTTQEWQDREGYVPTEDSMAIYTDYRITSGGIDIPGIKIGDGTTAIEDLPFITDWEDEKIEELEDYVRSLFLGETTTALYDGYTSPSIVIDGEVIVAKNGNIAVYNRREFIWDEANGKWVELGVAVFVPGTGANSAQQAGTGAVASGISSVAEGNSTAFGQNSHAEGNGSFANGENSHAEGSGTIADGATSHAEGRNNTTTNEAEHSEGKYNVSISGSTIHTVGIGTSSVPKNAHTITIDGKHYIPGVGTYVGTETTLPSGQDLATIINSKVEGVFIAAEGSTSFADVNAAIDAGREVICSTPAGYAYLTQKASSYITFEALPSSSYNGASRKVTIDDNNNWTPSYVGFELVYDTTNKKLKKNYGGSTYVDVVTAVKIVEDGAATANLISQSDFDAIFN